MESSASHPPLKIVLLAFTVWGMTRLGAFAASLNFQMDELYFFEWGRGVGAGSFPVGDALYQYPPGAGLLFHYLDLSPTGFHRAFTGLMLLSDLFILLILMWCALRRGESWRGAWAWILGGYLAGGLLYERFDVFSTLLAVAATVTLARPAVSGAWAGLGAMVKVWPGLTLLGVARSRLPWALGGAVASAATVLLVGFLTADSPLAFLANQVGRGLQIESTGAAIFLAGDALGFIQVTSVDQFGASQIDHPLATTVGWLFIVLGAFQILVLVTLRLLGRLESLEGADVVLVAVLVLVVCNKVHSPQFFIWLIGIGAVALLSRRTIMTGPVILIGLSMIPSREYVGVKYWALQAVEPLAVGFQTLRILLLLAALIWAWVALFRHARRRVVDGNMILTP